MTPLEIVAAELRRDDPYLADADIDQILQGWELVPFEQGGQITGVACLKGSEFHCMTLPGFKLRRAQMREFLRPMFDRLGFLTTRVKHGDTANERFNSMFGFERTWSDDTHHFFLMADLPFGKEPTCP